MKSICVTSIAALAFAAVVTDACDNLSTDAGQNLECNGSCVQTWKKCAGEGIASGTIRPCCNTDDHCVEKTFKFSQCRPRSSDIPPSWPSGAILTCTAFRFADNDDIELDFLDNYDLDVKDTTCLKECQDNDECFAFDETADGECTLFGKNLFTLEGTLHPFFDAELFLTKCFLPEPLCDPATREVRQVNPLRRDDGNFHWMAAESDVRDFYVTDTPASYVLTAAINACRLQQRRLGGCIGFAIEGPSGRDGHLVTLLYDFIDSSTTTAYRGDLAEDPKVYSIAACL